MKRGHFYVLGGLLVLMVVIALGPRPPIDETIRFNVASIPPDIDHWLAKREAAVPGIKPGTEKEIVWADPQTKAVTPLAIIYVHGFSATKWETRPLCDNLAREFHANLFYTRLTGHGATGAAMAKASMNDWVNDMAEAIAIGERIGKRIVIVATSSGGTLATWAAGNERLMGKVIGMALISPNYEVRGASIGLLNMPWGRVLLPLIFGGTRSFEPVNEAHGKWWTTSYPSTAVFSLAALMKVVHAMDYSQITVPAFFIFSPNDQVVVPAATRKVYERWGAPKKILEVEHAGDPNNHVIAGDILSPDNTQMIGDQIAEWIRTLKR